MGYCDRDIIELQARAHPIERMQRWQSPEQYCLYLMHLRAYHEAGALARNLTVLDVGCNNGWGSRILAETARKVLGVDVSLNALSEAASTDCLLGRRTNSSLQGLLIRPRHCLSNHRTYP